MAIYTEEFVVSEKDIVIEDSGAAMICEPLSVKETGGDGCFYINLTSYDDSVFEERVFGEPKEETAQNGHKIMHELIGKKVRVTVEIIEGE